MSVVFPINPATRVQEYTASAGQTVFSVPFPFQEDRDLTIVHVAAGDGTETPLTLVTDYTLTGKATSGPGSLTLVTPAAAGDRIRIIGDAVLDRLTSIVREGRYSSAAQDAEHDRHRIIQQELRRDADRAIKAKFGQDGLIMDVDAIGEGRALLRGPGDTIVEGPTADEVAAAQGYAEDAADSRDIAVDAAERAEEAVAGVEYPVSYGLPQTLASAQKLRAQVNVGLAIFDTVDDLLADTVLDYSTGTGKVQVAAGLRVDAGDFRYTVAAAGATDHNVETAGGLKLYVRPWADGKYPAAAWGLVSDSPDGLSGTDQTAELVAIVDQLNSAGVRGTLVIPERTRFDKNEVYGEAEAGIMVEDWSLVNWYNSPGYKTRIRNFYSSDEEADDASTMFASNHHPSIFLNNFGTAGSTSANVRACTILYGAGAKPNKEYMTGLYEQVAGLGGVWTKTLYLQTPFDIATKVKPWAANTVYTAGDIVVIYPGSGRVYECTVGGTSGTTAPSHTSSTATDGTVTWLYRQAAIEVNGTTIERTTVNGDKTLVNSRGGDTVTLTMTVVNASLGNYSATLVADTTNNTTSITCPVGNTVNVGKTGASAGVSVAGFSVFNGASGATTAYLTNGASGGTNAVISSVLAAASTFVSFRYNGGSVAGSISHNGAGTTTYNTTSDARFKTNLEDFDAGALIDAIEVYRYDWTHGRGGGYGVMAQAVYEVFPDAVTPGQGEPEDEDFTPWGVDYSKFVPLLLREVQELRRRVAELEGA